MFNKLKKTNKMPFFGKCGCSSSKRIELEEVHQLNYAHNNLLYVPEEIILNERTLEELYLDANRISELPKWLFQCHGLRVLNLNDNEFTSISQAIGNLINLENLNLSKNAVREIPDTIKNCKRLTILDASDNPIARLPDGFMMLLNLRELYLNDTLLDFLPGSFGRLSKLKILEIRENHLKSLPKSLSRLVDLERLDLGQNHFEIFPEVVYSLSNLVELLIDSNQIEYLSNEIGNLKNLILFDMSKNRLKKLPNEIGDCSNLSDFYLSENHLEQLPESLGRLGSLTILKLDSNRLNSVPFSIGGLTNLSELILSNNKISQIPTSIGLLRNLRTFNLDENMISDIPCDIGSCTGITLFSLRANNLETIPEEIGRITRLRVLNLSSNRLKYLPFSISKLKELQALWLSENQTKSLIPLQHEKDGRGRRFLTCYLFPQEQARDVRKPNLGTLFPNDFYSHSLDDELWNVEQNDPREHLIRFSTQDNPNNTHKPYPKESKNHEYQLRNRAIYENTNLAFSQDSTASSSLNEELMAPCNNDLLLNMNHDKENLVKFSCQSGSSPRRIFDSSNKSPNLNKLNHQKLITQIHMDRVQDMLQNSPKRQLKENRSIHELIYGSNSSSNELSMHQKKLFNHPISILKQTKFTTNEDYESDFEILPTPQKTPQIESSIQPLPIFKAKPINLDAIKSPLLQTALNIPSSPLKVNVETKWIGGQSRMHLQNDGPSSQVSSDSGYSSQTLMNMHKQESNASEEKCLYLNVSVIKTNGLGFSIAGGKDSIGNPFKLNDPGIFVTKVQTNGPADGVLKPGDQLIKVNGEDFTNIEHDKAVGVLKSCNKNANILLRRC